MGSAALKPSLAIGRLLREKRKERRLTLREVSERMAERGGRIPISTLVRIEQGKLDPGVRRLHALLRFYDVPPHLVADLVELEDLAVEQPATGDLDTLFRNGLEYWKRGDIGQGLAHLMAVREFLPRDDSSKILRQKATISFAVAARNLGKYRLAKQIIDDLLCEPPDPQLLVRALVLAASLWRGLGSIEVALALVDRAELHVAPNDRKTAAWVNHQKAKLLLDVGKPEEAKPALELSLDTYRNLNDTYGYAKALILRGEVLEACGCVEDALSSAREAIRWSTEHDHERLITIGELEVGRLLAASGSIEGGIELIRKGLGRAVLIGDKNAEFLAHYRLWKAYETYGDRERARFELESARHFVRFVDDYSPEVVEVRKQ